MSVAKSFVLIFFVLVILNTSQWLFVHIVEFNPAVVLGGSLLLPALIALIFGTALYVKTLSAPLISKYRSSFRAKVLVLVGALIVLSIYGIFQGNLLRNIFIELWAYSVVICFMILGQYDRVWRDLEKPFIVIFWAAFAMVVSAIPYARQHLLDGGLSSVDFISSRPTYTLAYDLSLLLDIWPVIFTLALVSGKFRFQNILAIGVIVAYIAIEIFFQKRAPTVRAGTYLLVGVLVLQYGKPFRISKLLPIALISTLIVFMMLPTAALFDRFAETDNSRFEEVRVAFSEMDGLDLLIGRGMGGYVELKELRHRLVQQVVNENGDYGRTILHIGAFYPVLKGGVVFFLLHLSFLWPFIARFRDSKWMQNDYNRVSVIVLPVYVIFRLIEGPFSSGAVFDGVIFGLCVSRAAVGNSHIQKLAR